MCGALPCGAMGSKQAEYAHLESGDDTQAMQSRKAPPSFDENLSAACPDTARSARAPVRTGETVCFRNPSVSIADQSEALGA